jgi:hypothetical protein
MPVQMRLSPSDERFYSPDRDLAYCTPHLVLRAMQSLDPDNQEPWIKEYLAANNITNDQLVEGAASLAIYLNKTMLDPQYKEPYDALNAAGFFSLPQAVQNVICMKLGQVFVSAFFSAIRDVTRDPNDPPMDTKAIAEVAGTLIKRLSRPKKRRFWERWW